jgi:hypothetical protein
MCVFKYRREPQFCSTPLSSLHRTICKPGGYSGSISQNYVTIIFSSLFAYIATPRLNFGLPSNHDLTSLPYFLPRHMKPILTPSYWFFFLPNVPLHNANFNVKPELLTVIVPDLSVAACTVTSRHLKALSQGTVTYAGC